MARKPKGADGKPDVKVSVSFGGSAGERLRGFIERVERLEEEKRALSADIREIYSEATAMGFEPKIMRKLVAERRMERHELEEQAALLDTYRHALGMYIDTPLGQAAMKQAPPSRKPLGGSLSENHPARK